MPAIEKQPIEQRQAYAIDELSKIVELATTIKQAQDLCNQKLGELIQQHILPNNLDDVQPVIDNIKEKIEVKFESEISKTVTTELFQQAEKLRAEKKYQEALKLYEQVAMSDPDNPSAFFWIGYLSDELGNYDQAIDAYRKTISLKPNHSSAFNNLGVSLRHKGLEKEAIQAFKGASDLDSAKALYRHNLGESYETLSMFQEAFDAFAEATKLDPNNKYYQESLTRINNRPEAQNIFSLTGLDFLSTDEKETHLDQIQMYLWFDFLDNDAPWLLTASQLDQLSQLRAKGDDSEEVQEEILIFIETIYPDLEKLMLNKAAKLKAELFSIFFAELSAKAKNNSDLQNKLPELEKLVAEKKWFEVTKILNTIDATKFGITFDSLLQLYKQKQLRNKKSKGGFEQAESGLWIPASASTRRQVTTIEQTKSGLVYPKTRRE